MGAGLSRWCIYIAPGEAEKDPTNTQNEKPSAQRTIATFIMRVLECYYTRGGILYGERTQMYSNLSPQ